MAACNDAMFDVYICSDFTAKAALKFGSEVWVLRKRAEQRLEAAQMKFLRHLLGITNVLGEKKREHRT